MLMMRFFHSLVRTAYLAAVDGRLPEARHIEVKGRIKGATTVTVTKNEIFESWNQDAKYHLAIVRVGEDDAIDGPPLRPSPLQGRTRLGRVLAELRPR